MSFVHLLECQTLSCWGIHYICWFNCLILHSLSIIWTSFCKDWCTTSSLCTWSAMPDFNVSLQITTFSCFSSLIFSGGLIPLLYSLPFEMFYVQFLVMFLSSGDFTLRRYLHGEPFLNTKLILYKLHILQIFSLTPLMFGRITIDSLMFNIPKSNWYSSKAEEYSDWNTGKQIKIIFSLEMD